MDQWVTVKSLYFFVSLFKELFLPFHRLELSFRKTVPDTWDWLGYFKHFFLDFPLINYGKRFSGLAKLLIFFENGRSGNLLWYLLIILNCGQNSSYLVYGPFLDIFYIQDPGFDFFVCFFEFHFYFQSDLIELLL